MIQLQPGTYPNDFPPNVSNLTVEAVGGMAHLVATVPPPNGKAWFVTSGNVTLQNLDISGVQEQTQKAETRLSISLDSISEFRVATSVYTAENGAAGGAQINVVSKAGTNHYHGSLFEYLRNSALDSPGAFDGGTVPPFRLNQFGADFGGPVIRNQAFFYTSYEGLRQSLDQTLIGFVPGASFRYLLMLGWVGVPLFFVIS